MFLSEVDKYAIEKIYINAHLESIWNTSNQLRVLYECNPMAHIIEQAGECATDGNKVIIIDINE